MKKEIFIRCINCLVLSSAFIVVSLVYNTHYLTELVRYPGTYLLSGIVIAMVFYLIGWILRTVLPIATIKMNNASESLDAILKSGRIKWLTGGYIVLLVIVYFSCFFAYFPGITAYDYRSSVNQVSGKEILSNHHPVAYTMIWKLFISIAGLMGDADGSKHYSNIMYAVVQITVVLLICIYLIRWMIKSGIPKLWILFTGMYFLFIPTLHLFSFSPTKDVPFACAIIFFSTKLIDYFKGKTSWISCLCGGILACLFRNNMVYVLIGLFIILLLMHFEWRKVIKGILPAVIFAMMFTKIILPVCGIRSTESAEYLSVPVNQISALYSFEAYFSEDERATIKQYMPEVENYNYRFADPVKNHFNNELYKKDTATFWKIYLSGLKQNPMIYLCAFIDTNSPLLYPLSTPIDEYNGREYIELGQDPGIDRERITEAFKYLRGYYDSIGSATNPAIELPFINRYFSLAFPFVSLITALFCMIILDKWKREDIIASIVLLLLLGTYLLGPVSNYRYCYPLYLSFPLYFGVIFKKG